MNIYCTCFTIIIITPDIIQKNFPGKYFTGIGDKQFKKQVLLKGQGNEAAGFEYLMFVSVDLYVPIFQQCLIMNEKYSQIFFY